MSSARDVYTQTALLALGLFFAAVAIFSVAVIVGDAKYVWVMLFYLVPGLIVLAGILRWPKWGFPLGLAGSIIGLLTLLEDADIVLTTPKVFFDFASALLGFGGLLTLLVVCLLATVARLRHRLPQGPGAAPMTLKAGAAVLVAIAAVSAVVTALNTGEVADAEAAGAIVVTAKRGEFDVQKVEGHAGEPVRILVRNDDPVLHLFSIPDLDVKLRLGPWSEQLVVVESAQPRNIGYVCSIFDHAKKMSGAIVFE